jgi:hypothetical protein
MPYLQKNKISLRITLSVYTFFQYAYLNVRTFFFCIVSVTSRAYINRMMKGLFSSLVFSCNFHINFSSFLILYGVEIDNYLTFDIKKNTKYKTYQEMVGHIFINKKKKLEKNNKMISFISLLFLLLLGIP